ncbi:MAG: hypothetical protein ACR2PO_05010 [Methyloligellaceae bacterium]
MTHDRSSAIPLSRPVYAAGSPQSGREAQVHLIGQDRNGDHHGTVFTATRILKGRGVSINALHTTTFSGCMTGEPMFATNANVTLPGSLDVAELIHALEQIASDIAVDIELTKRTATRSDTRRSGSWSWEPMDLLSAGLNSVL